jgi:trigger factor
MQQATRFPGQERQVVEFYQTNPEARASVQAPLFEDKVVDFILEMAKIEDVTVAAEDLFRDDDAPAEEAKDAKSTKAKPAAKKPAAKKPAAKKTAAKKPAAKKPAAKKSAAKSADEADGDTK